MVPEGMLNFEVCEEEISIGPGEVIAIHADVSHAAYSTDLALKTVDA